MRPADENKKKAIAKAAIHLINTEGFDGASMSKIAKLAGISPASIYTYFENKEDMLIKLYIMVKEEIGKTLNKNFDPDMEIKDGIRMLFDNIIKSYKEAPDNFAFKEQFANCPLVANVCEEAMNKYFGNILAFWQRGIKEGVLKDVSFEYIGLYLLHPLSFSLKQKNAVGKKLTKIEKDILFNMAWDAIKK